MESHRIRWTCKDEKPFDLFDNSKTDPEGKSRRCKACTYAASRKWAAKNLEKVRANERATTKKKYRESEEFREKKRAEAKAYRKTEAYQQRTKTEEYRERYRRYVKDYSTRNADILRERRNTPENKEKFRANALMKKYGLTPPQLEAMKAKNNGKCWVCDQEVKRLCVDHCHETGKVRGILCDPCNTTLGWLGDNIQKVRESTERFVAYLEAAETSDVTIT